MLATSHLAKLHDFGTVLRWVFCFLVCFLAGSGEEDDTFSTLLGEFSQAIENENKNYLKCKTAGPGEKTLHRQQLAIRLLHSSRKSALLRLVQAGASERQLLRRQQR